MTYDVQRIINEGLTIVYGLSDSEKTIIEQQLYKERPKLRTTITDMFSSSNSIGPFKFKVKKTVKELLMSDKMMKRLGINKLESHAKKLKCDHILERKPQSLSWGQKLRASLILDWAHDKTDYLFIDCKDYNGAVNAGLYIPVSEWMLTYCTFEPTDYCVIWLTSAKEEDFLQLLADSDSKLQENCTLFAAEKGRLVDRKDLLKGFKDEKRTKEAATHEKEEKAQTVRRQEQKKTEVRLEQKPQQEEKKIADDDKMSQGMYNIMHVLMGDMEFKGDSNKILMDFFSSEKNAEFFYNWVEKETGKRDADILKEAVKSLQAFENGTLIGLMTKEEAESHRNFIKKKAKDKIMEPYRNMIYYGYSNYNNDGKNR